MDRLALQSFSLPLATVNQLCRHHGLPRAVGCQRLERGEANALFEVDLAGGERAVLKVFCRATDTSGVRREAALLQHVRHGGLPAPAWAVADESSAIVPYPCLLLARVDGVDADEVWLRLDEADRSRLLRNAGALLARLHALPLPDCDQPPRPATWAAREERDWEQALRQIDRQDWMELGLRREVERVFDQGLPRLRAAYQPALLHYDFQFWNLRLDPESLAVAGLLDLHSAVVGPPVADARDLELNLFLAWPEWRREFWRGYGAAPDGGEAARLRIAALVRAMVLLARYWGRAPQVGPEQLWLLLQS